MPCICRAGRLRAATCRRPRLPPRDRRQRIVAPHSGRHLFGVGVFLGWDYVLLTSPTFSRGGGRVFEVVDIFDVCVCFSIQSRSWVFGFPRRDRATCFANVLAVAFAVKVVLRQHCRRNSSTCKILLYSAIAPPGTSCRSLYDRCGNRTCGCYADHSRHS